MSVFFGLPQIPLQRPTTPRQYDDGDHNMNVYRVRFEKEHNRTSDSLNRDPHLIALEKDADSKRTEYLDTITKYGKAGIHYMLQKAHGPSFHGEPPTDAQIEDIDRAYGPMAKSRKAVRDYVKSHMPMAWNDLDIHMRSREERHEK